MNFPYLRTCLYEDEIDIPNIGNVNIKAYNDEGDIFVLIIITDLGISHIYQYSKKVNVSTGNIENLSEIYYKMNFSQFKLKKLIGDFLNNSSTKITQVELIDDYKELLDEVDSVKEYINNIKNKY